MTATLKAATRESYQERVMRAVVALERNLDARPSLRALAREAFLSPFHFHRIFRAVVGESLSEYARRLRFERAAHELTTTRRTVAAIGREAGYRRTESFTRGFTKHFGSTPTEFRATQRDKWTARPALAARPEHSGRIERFEPLTVAFIRHVGPYENVPPVFGQIAEWIASRATLPAEPLFAGVAHDDPSITPKERLRFDCCVEADGRVRPAGPIAVQRILGGHYAVALHRGSFERIHETYMWLAREFVPSQGASIRKAAAVELYVTSPEATPGAEQLTEVLLPVNA